MARTEDLAITRAYLRAGLLRLEGEDGNPARAATDAGLATVIGNIAYYGYAPSQAAVAKMATLTPYDLAAFWAELEPALENLTGTDRDMDAHIVYKNFPSEVIDMSRHGYWIRQILIYVGFKDLCVTDKEDREKMSEPVSLKILAPSKEIGPAELLARLIAAPATWTDGQFEDATALFTALDCDAVDFNSYKAKANAARLAATLIEDAYKPAFTLSAPIDALRLIAVLSGGDVRLTGGFRFASLKRALRDQIVFALDAFGAPALAEAFAQRRNMWKQVLMRLHPGDYAVPDLNAAYDLLYRSKAEGFEATLVKEIEAGDPNAMTRAALRPGVFARRLRHLYKAFGRSAFEAFVPVMSKLTTLQLARLDRIFATLEARKTRLVAPRGQLGRAKLLEPAKITVANDDIAFLRGKIDDLLRARMTMALPDGVAMGQGLDRVKIAMNGQTLSPHGRGTRFAIPAEVNFIRSMSYWDVSQDTNVWFDNSWNFFDADWKPAGALCWDSVKIELRGETAAVFSGDPATSQSEGSGAQAIDLYLDVLAKKGIRYAVWSTLCYSHIPFSKARDVFACLQWGEDAQKGEIFEPSRAQMAFPIKSEEMSNITAMIDLETRELVYLDAALPVNVGSARQNETKLSEMVPALLEVIDAQPSWSDIFARAPAGTIPVLVDDTDAPVKGPALVSRPLNPDSEIDPVDLDALLAAS